MAPLALLCTAVLSLPTLAEDAPKLADLLADFEAGRYAEVVEAAERVPADSKELARVRFLVGESQLVLGAADEAAEAFEGVLALKPDAVVARIGLARARTASGDSDGAITLLTAVLEDEPKHVHARVALGEALMTSDVERANRVLEEAYDDAPKDPRVVRARVEVLLHARETEQALKVAKRFAKAERKHPLGPFLQALVHEVEQKAEPAIKAYLEALELDDRYLDAHKNLAILCHTRSDTYQNQARVRLAMEHYERYFELGGADPHLREMYDVLIQFFAPQKDR